MINNLTNGKHTVRVYSQDGNGKELSNAVEFTVDSSYNPPELLILSPQNQTHATTELPLTYACVEKIVFAHYTLDNGSCVTLTGNTTLTGLTNGTHMIKITAWTERDHAIQTMNFSVNINSELDNTFGTDNLVPTLTVVTAGSVAGAAAVLFFLRVHFKKRKHPANSDTPHD